MIFADKLILLRKKAGWSQEELAAQMNVTRQSVSKWEGAQSIPDLDKIIRLSNLFGVSTDYLLKDEIEETEIFPPDDSAQTSSLRQVSIEEANAFLAVKAETAKSIAFAAFLCIISPICLFILGALGEMKQYAAYENILSSIGMIILLVFVAVATAIFIYCGSKTSRYEFLEKEIFETEYGVSGMVNERRERYEHTYTKYNIAGTCLCILALIPLFAGAAIAEDNDLLMTVMLSLTFICAGIGVILFIRCGIIWESFKKLLQESDFSAEKKENSHITGALSTTYWLTATAIYLAYSLATANWGYSWIIWVVAGLLFPAMLSIINLIIKKK